MFTIYKSGVQQDAKNCLYPYKIVVKTLDDLKNAVSNDYVSAEYKGNYRSIANFISADLLTFDCDNDHSDEPGKWVHLEDVKEAFPHVSFAVHYSRNHMLQKGAKSARPRFHVFFPINKVTSSEEYAELKKQVRNHFPFFDSNALDAARFFFGTHESAVELIIGEQNLTDFLAELSFSELGERWTTIPSGQRNSTLLQVANRTLKRMGEKPEAKAEYLRHNDRCDIPLEESELEAIWQSALKFYRTKILTDENYIPPDEFKDKTYKPKDYSDVGQALVLAAEFGSDLRYSPQTNYMRFRKTHWSESEPGAQKIAQKLTELQLREAELKLIETHRAAQDSGAMKVIKTLPKTKQQDVLTSEQTKAMTAYKEAVEYHDFVIKRRSSMSITATLKEARPHLEISVKELDANPFLLCTPAGTYDLRHGVKGRKDHDPRDYITNITTTSPGEKGEAIWEKALTDIFSEPELIEYVQLICGLAIIGKVFIESLIIAYGDGGNGKSTFWNAIARVLGTYYGNLSADALVVNTRRNMKPEMAELRGKRLILAAESQEGARLNESMVKQICSTDDIFAEKKYKDPFKFTPTHTAILYTNHLPKVGASDEGIWRRIIVIPFNNKLTGEGDIKNYADVLVETAGESILTWLIEGARKVIAADYKIQVPQMVISAISEYREQNDWLQNFLFDVAEINPEVRESSKDLYQAYRLYCMQSNEFVRSTGDFYAALAKAGYERVEIERKRWIVGLKLKKDEGAADDFLL